MNHCSDGENPIIDKIRKDLDSTRFDRVHTRFAPEPNAYIHLGSAISVAMTYGAAEAFGGLYNLRFDDTNPEAEKAEYVDSTREDLRWLGYDWGDREFFASGYLEENPGAWPSLGSWPRIEAAEVAITALTLR